MPGDAYAIAKDMAQRIVREAQRKGFDWRPERGLFTVSDTANLADEIAWWLDKHMRSERRQMPQPAGGMG